MGFYYWLENMKRNFNYISEVDTSKLKVRSKQEIIERIKKMENEFDSYIEALDSMPTWEKEREIRTAMFLIHEETRILDWVLNIN